MKIPSITAAAITAALFALPAAAEPASFKLLSVHADQSDMTSAGAVQVVDTAGMAKYGPYSARFTDVSADTEIAVFEEVNSGKEGHVRPARADRIPSM